MFSRSNVNEEYMQAFRTKSYLDMWSKAQSQIERREEECHSSSPFPPCFHLSDFLLEPQQETLLAMINDSQPHTLVLDYFNGSLEACRICDFLLHCITQMRTNYHIIQTVLQHTKQAKGNYTDEQCQFITAAFMSFAKLENPLSGPSSVDFQQTHDLYGSMLKKLMSKCRKLKRKVKVINIGFLQLSKIQNIQVVAPPCSSRGGLSSSQKKGISTVGLKKFIGFKTIYK
eukprot:TRINITY_DN25012_c0_g1_i5.p1 TRINITY_DN25012_c0_g1~~TRINITY_DN25012_c0_g1_i5.p1  ORF type:complete len:229 (-),score=39.50 TRINITY_DN25012_c0_g1_i5:392-1078(-)